MPYSGQEYRYRDETVSSGAPEIFDEEILCPLVRYPDLKQCFSMKTFLNPSPN